MPLIRLDKLITDTGLCSRSSAKAMVRSGRVAVDGVCATDASAKLDPVTATVTVDGEAIDRPGHIYVMLHKPAGLLSASSDARKPTVLDLMPEAWKRRGLFCVGRLDKDTTGLLLLTDDGAFAHRVISPRSRVPKLYEAVVEGAPTQADVRAFADGLLLGDGLHCLPARLLPQGGGLVHVEVFEGKYHQVKRMLASRGMPVSRLKRLSIGALALDETLKEGEYRELQPSELFLLQENYMSK